MTREKKSTKKSPAYGRGFKPNFSVTVLDNFFVEIISFFLGEYIIDWLPLMLGNFHASQFYLTII